MRRLIFACILVCVLTTPALAQKKGGQTRPEPAEHPDWVIVRRDAEKSLTAGLFDPTSAQFTWRSGFRWGSVKPALERRRWGWIACVSMNAKNRFGGYVGASDYWVAYSPEEGYSSGLVDEARSQCDKIGTTPLQLELVDAPPSPAGSVTDELTKLASLLDRGLITREEFEAQKARLLPH